MGEGEGHLNFVVIAPMIMKFGTGMILEGNKIYKMRKLYVITCILA